MDSSDFLGVKLLGLGDSDFRMWSPPFPESKTLPESGKRVKGGEGGFHNREHSHGMPEVISSSSSPQTSARRAHH